MCWCEDSGRLNFLTRIIKKMKADPSHHISVSSPRFWSVGRPFTEWWSKRWSKFGFSWTEMIRTNVIEMIKDAHGRFIFSWYDDHALCVFSATRRSLSQNSESSRCDLKLSWSDVPSVAISNENLFVFTSYVQSGSLTSFFTCFFMSNVFCDFEGKVGWSLENALLTRMQHLSLQLLLLCVSLIHFHILS